MFELNKPKAKSGPTKPGGVLSSGWRATLADVGRSMAWESSGAFLCTADAAGYVTALRATSGEVLWRVPAHRGGALVVALQPQPSGLVLSCGEDGRAVLLLGQTGEQVKHLDVSSGWLEHAAWSPDGRTFALAAGKVVRLYAAHGQELGELEVQPATIAALTWANATELVTACYGQVCVWDVANLRLRERFASESPPVSLAVSADGRVIATGNQDSCVTFWRRPHGEKSAIHGYARKPSALCFGPAGAWLATSGGEATTIWRFDTGGPEGTDPLTLGIHTLPVNSLVAASGRNVLASGGRDGGVIVWKISPEEGEVAGFALCEAPIEALAFRPDNAALAAATRGGVVESWRCRLNKV